MARTLIFQAQEQEISLIGATTPTLHNLYFLDDGRIVLLKTRATGDNRAIGGLEVWNSTFTSKLLDFNILTAGRTEIIPGSQSNYEQILQIGSEIYLLGIDGLSFSSTRGIWLAKLDSNFNHIGNSLRVTTLSGEGPLSQETRPGMVLLSNSNIAIINTSAGTGYIVNPTSMTVVSSFTGSLPASPQIRTLPSGEHVYVGATGGATPTTFLVRRTSTFGDGSLGASVNGEIIPDLPLLTVFGNSSVAYVHDVDIANLQISSPYPTYTTRTTQSISGSGLTNWRCIERISPTEFLVMSIDANYSVFEESGNGFNYGTVAVGTFTTAAADGFDATRCVVSGDKVLVGNATHVQFWQLNRPPNTPNITTINGEPTSTNPLIPQVVDTNMNIVTSFSDPDGDTLTNINLQVRDASDTTVSDTTFANTTGTFTTDQGTNIPPNQQGSLRIRQQDSQGFWSEFSSFVYVQGENTLPLQPTITSFNGVAPSTDIGNPQVVNRVFTITATYSDPDGDALALVNLEVLDATNQTVVNQTFASGTTFVRDLTLLLDANTDYRVRLRQQDSNGGYSPFSVLYYISIENTIPDTPTISTINTLPASTNAGSPTVVQRDLTIVSTYNDPDGDTINATNLQILDEASVTVYDQTLTVTSSTLSVDLTATLTANTRYSLRVRHRDVNNGFSAFSDFYFIQTANNPPDIPVITFPASTDVGAPTNAALTPTIVSTYNDPDGDALARMRVQANAVTTPANSIDTGFVANTTGSLTIGPLVPGDTYGIIVTHEDVRGAQSTPSATHYLAVGNVPLAPTWVSPVDNSRTPATPVLTWTLGTDVENDLQHFRLTGQRFTYNEPQKVFNTTPAETIITESRTSQTGWEAFNIGTSTWVALPSGGIRSTEYSQVRFTIPSTGYPVNNRYTFTVAAYDVSLQIYGNESVSRGFRFGNRLRFITVPVDTGATRVTRVQGGFIGTSTGATRLIEVTNNLNDVSPTWEDATTEIVAGQAYTLTNATKTAATWAVGARVTVTVDDTIFDEVRIDVIYFSAD